MSATAEAIVKQIRALPAEEQREVVDEVLALKEATQWAALKRLRGCAKGEGLLEKLLADRAKDSAAESDPVRSARGMAAGSGLTEALLESRAEERRRG